MKSKAQKQSVKITKTKRSTTPQREASRPMPLMRAFHQALDWAFEIAVSRVSHSDDIAAVERVRDALEARIASRFMPVSIEDLQFASDLLIAAMDTDTSNSLS